MHLQYVAKDKMLSFFSVSLFFPDIPLSFGGISLHEILKFCFMFEQLVNLNWISVLLAFAAYFLLGALWFTLFFSNQYRIFLGGEGETLQRSPILIAGPAVCTLLITIANTVLIYTSNITAGSTWEFSLFVGFGFLVANTVNIAINPNIPRPVRYGIITGTYHLTGIATAGIIVIAMK